MTRELRFYFDVVCPYAYLASTQVARIAADAGDVADRALLDEIAARHGIDPKAIDSDPVKVAALENSERVADTDPSTLEPT